MSGALKRIGGANSFKKGMKALLNWDGEIKIHVNEGNQHNRRLHSAPVECVRFASAIRSNRQDRRSKIGEPAKYQLRSSKEWGGAPSRNRTIIGEAFDPRTPRPPHQTNLDQLGDTEGDTKGSAFGTNRPIPHHLRFHFNPDGDLAWILSFSSFVS